MDIYCDNFSVCGHKLADRTEEQARAKNWHIFHGQDHAGRTHDGVLCPACVSVRTRLPLAPKTLPGQLELFE
jgi:hypothetical protein